MKVTRILGRFILLAGVFLYISTSCANAISIVGHRAPVKINSGTLPRDSVSFGNLKSVAAFAVSLRDANGGLLKFKQRKQLLKKQLSAIRQSPDKTKNQKVLLTILAILAFLGIVAVLAIIAYNGLAGLWPVVGLAISIALLVFVLKRIWRKSRN